MDFVEILQDYNRAVDEKNVTGQEALSPVIAEAKRMAAGRGRKCSVTEEELLTAMKSEIGKLERQIALAGPTHRELGERYRQRKDILETYLHVE